MANKSGGNEEKKKAKTLKKVKCKSQRLLGKHLGALSLVSAKLGVKYAMRIDANLDCMC